MRWELHRQRYHHYSKLGRFGSSGGTTGQESTISMSGRTILERQRYVQTGISAQDRRKQKTISLAEYRVLHPHEVSKLTVKKSTRGYNNMKRVMPGALVRWHGKLLTVSGKHKTRYRFVETNICKEAPASECTIIRHNNGWAFI